MKKIVVCVGLLGCLLDSGLYGFAPVNFLKSDDPFYRMYPSKRRGACVTTESGRMSSSLNFDSKRRNFLALYDDNQSVIPMLRNPIESVDTLIMDKGFGALKNAPTRVSDGLVSFSGAFQETDVTIFGGYGWKISKVPGRFLLGLYVPSKTKKVMDITFKDLTGGIFASSKNLQAFIADLKTNLKDLGGIGLEEWAASGIGDIMPQLEWSASIKQQNGLVNNVVVLIKLGLLIPTGRQKDEDLVFSMPMGSDGAWGIPAGFGFELNFERYCRAGMYADFLGLVDDARVRRMKTHLDQTNFLLLNKGDATKRHGLLWHVETFLQWYHAVRGLSLKLSYQLVKQHNDHLTTKNDQFSNEIINTAKNLKGWHVHNVLAHVSYDFAQQFDATAITPSISFFYKLPLGGKAVVDNQTFGGQFAVSF